MATKYPAAIVLLFVCVAGYAAWENGGSAASTSATRPDSVASPEGGSEPYRLVSSGTAKVAPGAQYAAGRIKRWFFGDYYRDVWTTALEVPIIDLEESAGGLTLLERGGGNQTRTLHLYGGDGHFYDLRSVNKDIGRSISEKYHGTFVERILQDQVSSLNPVGALLVTPLAHAAGILHTSPSLVVIPDSPRLGPFRDEFAGMLALFERDPDEDQSDAARFGFSKNVVGTEKLFEKLGENDDNRVDVRAYVRARLFDMLIGDWDRHEGQWRWAEFETERGMLYVPVPTDRDGAFSKFDGLLPRLGRLTGKMSLRRMTEFGGDISDVFGLNWQGSPLDRRLATDLTREDWVAIADSLKRSLPDDVIDRAVRTWPDPVYGLIGPMTARHLKSRRDILPSVASSYYDVLADAAETAGTGTR